MYFLFILAYCSTLLVCFVFQFFWSLLNISCVLSILASILLLKSLITFTIIILNSFCNRLSILFFHLAHISLPSHFVFLWLVSILHVSGYYFFLLLFALWWMKPSKKFVQGSWGETSLVSGAGLCPSGGQGHAQEDFKKDGAVFLPYWLFGWGISVLEYIDYWVRLMAASGRAHANENSFRIPAAGVFVPAISHSYSHLCRRLFNTSRCVWPILLWVHCPPTPAPGSGAQKPCVHPSRLKSLVLLVLWNSCDQTPLASKGRFSLGFSSHCQIPRLKILTWGSGVSVLWENFCGTMLFQFVGSSSNRYGIRFYHCAPPSILLWLLFCFGYKVSFLVGSSGFPFFFFFWWFFSSHLWFLCFCKDRWTLSLFTIFSHLSHLLPLGLI